MKPRAKFNGVRLAAGGVASLFLLIWLAFIVPHLSTLLLAFPLLGTAAICVAILVVLVPVLIAGSWQERFMASLLAVFPLLVLLTPFWSRLFVHA